MQYVNNKHLYPHQHHCQSQSSTTLIMIIIFTIIIIYRYAKHQLQRYRQELIPTDQWQETPDSDQRRESYHNYEFSSLGKKLMSIEPWDSCN